MKGDSKLFQGEIVQTEGPARQRLWGRRMLYYSRINAARPKRIDPARVDQGGRTDVLSAVAYRLSA